jgi:hypothetical protein
MLSRITRVSALVLFTVLVVGLSSPAAAKTLTIKINAKLGPVLSGSDPGNLNGKQGSVTVKASESLSPTKHSSNSATYTLPPGAIVITAGSDHFKTTTKSTMTVTLTSSADILTLNASGSIEGLNVQVTDTSYLKTGSWTSAVLKHPTTFSPSPQNLTPAKTANGPGSKLKYVVEGSTTVLGVTGTASSSDPAKFFLPRTIE